MPAWGAKGGGPLTTQNLQNLIDYMETFQITPAEAQKAAAEQLTEMMTRKDQSCVDAKTEQARIGLSAEDLAAFDPSSVDTASCSGSEEGDAARKHHKR